MSTRRPTWIAALCWPALLLALAGSVSNLAWSFASVQAGNLVLGYIQAGAVDLGLIALAVGIAARRKAGRPTGWLWGGIGFFGLISTYGNLLHGYAHAQAVAAPLALAVARPVVLAAVLPALVLILSEVVGHDLRNVGAPAAKSPQPAPASEDALAAVAKPAEMREGAGETEPQPITHEGNGTHRARRAWVPEAIALRSAHPDWTQAQIAQAVGVHPSTIARGMPEETP